VLPLDLDKTKYNQNLIIFIIYNFIFKANDKIKEIYGINIVLNFNKCLK